MKIISFDDGAKINQPLRFLVLSEVFNPIETLHGDVKRIKRFWHGACLFTRCKLKGDKMKNLLLGSLLTLITINANAYISGIAIQTEKSSNMQVYVNGKLYNKEPGNFVRIKSKPGLFHVKVKVLNPYDNIYYVIRKDIRVEKGYEFFYRMVFAKGKRPVIQEIRRYPVYSKYFLNPMLYNRHPTT